jgi:ABC-type glycerol-3-phosphate transport system permease component
MSLSNPTPTASSVDVSERYQKVVRRNRALTRTAKWLLWTVLLSGAVLMMVPLYVMLAMSFKTPSELAATSMMDWPKAPTWANFHRVLTNPDVSFFRFFQNTAVISVLSTIGVLVSSSLTAYGFARVEFRGRDRLFILLLSTMMLPGIVTMIPTYVLYKYLYWVDTFYPLWVPAWLGGGAFNVFLLRQFFKGIPKELDEAAILDGASHATIFWRIIAPLSGPALATVGIFAFIGSWRDFMGPLLYLNSTDKQTLELGLNTYGSLNAEEFHLLMAGSVLVMIPIIVLFILGQRYFIKGIVLTGGK